jgi:hypothetical protein
MENYNFTTEEVEQHIKGMRDVKEVIYKIINNLYEHLNPIQPISLNVVMKRQTDHLTFMLTIQDIVEYGTDLSEFETAITDGNNWLQNNS